MGELNCQHRLMLEPEAYRLLQAYGIPVPAYHLATCVEQAVTAAQKIGFPVAMKIVSQDVVHKSDVGGVKLHLASAEEVRGAYGEIVALAQEQGFAFDGVLISEMVGGGIETIIGLSEDQEFGKYIVFGLGGVFVELFADISLRVLPIQKKDAEAMVTEVKSSKLLAGYRGDTPKDTAALVDILVKLAKMAQEKPLVAVDLNPVIVKENGAVVVDARFYTGDQVLCSGQREE
ncbi:MAG: acetate--CoA ligase family protein [bacterium]